MKTKTARINNTNDNNNKYNNSQSLMNLNDFPITNDFHRHY